MWWLPLFVHAGRAHDVEPGDITFARTKTRNNYSLHFNLTTQCGAGFDELPFHPPKILDGQGVNSSLYDAISYFFLPRIVYADGVNEEYYENTYDVDPQDIQVFSGAITKEEFDEHAYTSLCLEYHRDFLQVNFYADENQCADKSDQICEHYEPSQCFEPYSGPIDYVGCQNTTVIKKACIPWRDINVTKLLSNETAGSDYAYANAYNLEDFFNVTHNYCRNFDWERDFQVPWCYTDASDYSQRYGCRPCYDLPQLAVRRFLKDAPNDVFVYVPPSYTGHEVPYYYQFVPYIANTDKKESITIKVRADSENLPTLSPTIAPTTQTPTAVPTPLPTAVPTTQSPTPAPTPSPTNILDLIAAEESDDETQILEVTGLIGGLFLAMVAIIVAGGLYYNHIRTKPLRAYSPPQKEEDSKLFIGLNF